MPRFEQIIFSCLIVALFVYFLGVGMYRDIQHMKSLKKDNNNKKDK